MQDQSQLPLNQHCICPLPWIVTRCRTIRSKQTFKVPRWPLDAALWRLLVLSCLVLCCLMLSCLVSCVSRLFRLRSVWALAKTPDRSLKTCRVTTRMLQLVISHIPDDDGSMITRKKKGKRRQRSSTTVYADSWLISSHLLIPSLRRPLSPNLLSSRAPISLM
ncbi:hypothetical protein HDV57DRAFT_486204 [Trichoderma longibrachiatum]